ncbi:hypothetical protein M527_25045 [Sphingobium indicum IP26]|nr:hypothetical protein M527_25045 [Sphingobium indicum IP26]
MNFDFSDIINHIDEDIKITEQQSVDMVAKTTLDATAALKLRTAVDTGEARGGWEPTVPTKFGEAGYVENNVSHIVDLNNGRSKKSPENFVETTVQQFNQGAA